MAGYSMIQSDEDLLDSMSDDEDAVNNLLVEKFAEKLIGKRKDAIQARSESGIERQWAQDLDAYNGTDGVSRADLFDVITADRPKKQRRRSSVFVHVTRQKTNTASARCADMLFPTNEKNWAIKPTPVPSLMRQLSELGSVQIRDPMPGPTQGQVLPHPEEMVPGENGQLKPRPLTGADVIADRMREAKERCDRMLQEIDDQLSECNYNRECRKVIKDAAKLGTGILKGPIVTNRIKKAWVSKKTIDGQPAWQMEVHEELRPMSTRVSPWDFYPSRGCTEDITHAPFVWEREIVSTGQLQDLSRVESYLRAPILECLKESPKAYGETPRPERHRRGGYQEVGKNTSGYELWTYTGEVDIEDLQCMGIEVDDRAYLIRLSAVVVMCNDRVIKIHLNPMEDGSHPYDVFNWESVDGSVWGVGIPFLMRYGQVTLNAAWRQMQDNAGVTHGPQIVINRKLIEPAERNDWEVHGMKLWYDKSEMGEDVRKAFAVFQIQDQQASLQNIINLALKFIDDETAIPMLAQGEMGSAPDKVGVATILMNSANVVMKQIARNWDDSVTNPHITRYYDWNMQFSDKEDIKGDFSVQALGSTALVVRDQQKQDVVMVANMAQSPMFQKYINPERLAKYAVEVSTIPDVLNSKEDIKRIEESMKNQPPPVAPAVEAAKIRAESSAKVAEIEARSEERNIELQAAAAMRDDEREYQKMSLQERLAVISFAHEKGMELERVKSDLMKLALVERAQFRREERQAPQ